MIRCFLLTTIGTSGHIDSTIEVYVNPMCSIVSIVFNEEWFEKISVNWMIKR